MASNRLRIGIVGAGNFSKTRVLPQLQTVSGAELVAVCNSTRESGERAAAQFGIERVLTDWRDLVALDGIDVVFNGTQAPLHHDIIIAALEAGKHVLTMNPLATSAAEAREIVQTARARPHLRVRQFPGFPTGPYMREDALVRRLLAEGGIGRVRQAADTWHTPYLALASHFEILNRWLGPHRRVTGMRKVFEGGSRRMSASEAIAELADGALVTYSHSTVVAEGAATPRIELHGEEGSIVVYAQAHGRETVYRAGRGDAQLQPVPVPADLREAWVDQRVMPVEAQFVAWVLEGTAPSLAIPTFEEGLKGLEFAEAFLASVQRGAWVELPGA